jgi:hypothetical protein
MWRPGAEHSSLQFKNRDGGNEEARRIFRSDPRYHIGIGFAVANFARSEITLVSNRYFKTNRLRAA